MLQPLLDITISSLFTFEPASRDFPTVGEECYCIQGASGFITKLLRVVGLLQIKLYRTRKFSSPTLSSVGLSAIERNLHGTRAGCFLLGNGTILVSAQEEGRTSGEACVYGVYNEGTRLTCTFLTHREDFWARSWFNSA